MSNILYSNVDRNLILELNARGLAGKTDRSTTALNFMLGKIANARITAYSGSSSETNVQEPFGVLGGETVRGGRYLPNGPGGYLTATSYTSSLIVFTADGQAKSEPSPKIVDETHRTGPFITDVTVNIGDHSMGLLNKATVQISIPNPTRDLEDMEGTWFRPGRFSRIEIQHPSNAVITASETVSRSNYTGGLLDKISLPPDFDERAKTNPESVKWAEKLKTDLRYMNRFQFEGLITSFEFSYTETGQVDATIYLTGTSNVFTDVSMFMSDDAKTKNATKPKTDIEINPTVAKAADQQKAIDEKKQPQQPDFFDMLDKSLNIVISKTDAERKNTGISKFEITGMPNRTSTDQYILYGQPYNPIINDKDIASFLYEAASSQVDLTTAISAAATASATAATASLAVAALAAITPPGSLSLAIATANAVAANAAAATASAAVATAKTAASSSRELMNRITGSNNAEATTTIYNRYITLGSLMAMTNYFISTKVKVNEKFAEIICNDSIVFSNYLPNLTSCIPNDILLLPQDPAKEADMNWYGELAYYSAVKSTSTSDLWPGVYENTPSVQRIFTSRIFINVEFIQKLLNSLSETNTKNFTLRNFLSGVSQRISYATAGAIDLKLMSYPEEPQQMFFIDTKYLKSSKSNILGKPEESVFAYSVPMMANHPFGTIVRNFQFKATLPENAKNMAYILNSGDEVTEDQIAPYVNFMYNSKDPVAINGAIAKYKAKHAAVLATLDETRQRLSLSPSEPEFIAALNRAIANYLKFPTDDIRKSQQITAPIFPFDVSFTIDGINGLKYGDVLTFDALPMRYRVHTVFSIIGIEHNVKSTGEWTTDVRCIMRPSIK